MDERKKCEICENIANIKKPYGSPLGFGCGPGNLTCVDWSLGLILAPLCKHYVERVEKCGAKTKLVGQTCFCVLPYNHKGQHIYTHKWSEPKRKHPCPTCEKAREICKDWSECTGEHFAQKLEHLRGLFTEETGDGLQDRKRVFYDPDYAE